MLARSIYPNIWGAKDFYIVEFGGFANGINPAIWNTSFEDFKNKEIVLKRFKMAFYLPSATNNYRLESIDAPLWANPPAPNNYHIIIPGKRLTPNDEYQSNIFILKFYMDSKSFLFNNSFNQCPSMDLDFDNIFVELGTFNNEFKILCQMQVFDDNRPTFPSNALTVYYKGFLEIYLNQP